MFEECLQNTMTLSNQPCNANAFNNDNYLDRMITIYKALHNITSSMKDIFF